jgi:hypothetical protein
MSTTAVSLTTRLRTWLFIAAPTALLIVAGVLAGGAQLLGSGRALADTLEVA